MRDKSRTYIENRYRRFSRFSCNDFVTELCLKWAFECLSVVHRIKRKSPVKHCFTGLVFNVLGFSGETVKTTEPESYKRLMTTNEANILGKLMKGVVENGTASALNGRGYTVAGKTGSAEFDENGSSHSWFIGYSNVDDPDLVVAIIVENGGTGSEAAVPIAEQIFDAYYYDKQ